MRPPLIAMVTDRSRYGDDPVAQIDRLVRAATAAASAGVGFIQVREPGLSDRCLTALVRRIVEATAGTTTKVLVNDRTDVALAAAAAGVHLRAASIGSQRVRDIVPPGFLIGRSVHSDEEAVKEQAERACDYLVFGTVFPTTSKPAGATVAGFEALASVCRRVSLPVLAIGGITRERFHAVATTGAAGIAAIGLFTAMQGHAASDWVEIVREIHAAYDSPLADAR